MKLAKWNPTRLVNPTTGMTIVAALAAAVAAAAGVKLYYKYKKGY